MEESYAHLQRRSVQSVAGTMDDTYEQINLSVHPTAKHQQCSTTPAVKVVLGLLGALFLVTLTIAVVAMVQISELNGKMRKWEQTQQTQQPGMAHPSTTSPSVEAQPTKQQGKDPSQPPSTRGLASLSPATPVKTTLTTTISPSDTRLTSCAAIYSSRPSAPSGVYTIHIGGRVQGRKVWCDMVTDGGGWTRFQRRQDGSVEFNRTWSEYQTGFGSADAEFWLGNDDLHTLSSVQPSELRVDLWDWEGNHRYATYSIFSVASEASKYTLHIAGYTGNASDALTGMHNSQQFSTRDRDNDRMSDRNCATYQGGGGGWWYGSCQSANLNGRYNPGGVIKHGGVTWYHWRNNRYSYKAVSMMVRPR